MNSKTKTSGSVRIVRIGAAAAILFTVAGALLLPRLFKEKTVDKGAAAFGKLPAAAGQAGAAAMEARPAIGMPWGGGFFREPRFEYSWTGGGWPDLPDKMAVYRRAAGEISVAEAKDLAAKFGLTGEAQTDEPIQPMDRNGGSAPDGPPTQVAPAPFKSYRFYDQASGKRLEIFAADGRFSYMIEGAWQAAEKNAGGRPAESRAKEIAVSFLKDKGLLSDAYTGPFAAQNGVVSSGVVGSDGGAPAIEEPKVIQPPYVEIQFGKKLGGRDIVEPSGEPSRYIASVTVGPGDLIMAASGEIPAVLEESAYPLMGPAAAFEEVKKGKFGGVRALGAPVPMMGAPADTPVQSPPGEDGQEMTPASSGSGSAGTAVAEPGVISGGTDTVVPGQPPIEPPNPAPAPPPGPEPIKVEFDKIELAYMLVIGADGAGYYQPSYVFLGKIGPAESRSDYGIAVPAVPEKYIKR